MNIPLLENIFINADKVVTRGDMYSEGDSMDKYVDEKIDRQHKVEAFKKFADKIPDANTPLPELQEFAKALTEIPQDRIDNAVALNREEKRQINDARSKANGALKILNNPQATDNEKKEAEKNLRQAVADARPALNKLANTLDRGIITVMSQWFKNIRDFLNRYKGNNDDEKRQAEMWHHRMDSTVEVLSKKTNVPDSLMNAMLVAHQNAKTAWLNLEKGSDGKKRKGPSNNFDDGFTAEDITLCKKEVAAAEKVNEFIGKVLANGTVIKKCYYEIEGNKFHNGDIIFMPKSNKKYEVKGYKKAAKPVDSKSVWAGFGAKKDSARYVYTPSTVSQDIKGSLLSTIFTRDSIYRITKKDKTIDSLVKVQDTLRCRVVVVDVKFSEDTNQKWGFDENNTNMENLYPSYQKYFIDGIPWKSLEKGEGKDKVIAKTIPMGSEIAVRLIASNSQITTDSLLISNTSNISLSSSIDSGYIKVKAGKFENDSMRLNIVAYPLITIPITIVNIDEENDDIQLVNKGYSTTSDTTIVVGWGKNRFFDSKLGGDDRIAYRPWANDSVITAGTNKICDTKANNTNIVSTNLSASNFEQTINSIFKYAVAKVTINYVQKHLAINYDLNRDSCLESSSYEELAIVQNAVSSNTLCLLDYPSDSKINGMYGFYSKAGFFFYRKKNGAITTNIYKTAAHELGHGQFNLDHPFHDIREPLNSQYPKRQNDDWSAKDIDTIMEWDAGWPRDKVRKYQWDDLRGDNPNIHTKNY